MAARVRSYVVRRRGLARVTRVNDARRVCRSE